MRRALAAAAMVTLVGGCPDQGAAEAAGVLEAVTRIGTAEANARPAMLDALAARELQDAQAASTRDTCVAAYRRLADAKAKLADVDPTGAEAGLEEAERLHDACRRALAGLRER